MKGFLTDGFIKKVNLTVCLFLLHNVALAQVQWEFTNQELTSYKNLIENNTPLSEASNNSPASLYLHNLKATLHLLLTENKAKLDAYEDNFEESLKIIEGADSSSPYKNFYLAELRLRAAFVYLKFDQQLESGWQFRQAFRLIEKNVSAYPNFLPNLKTIGLIHILVGSIPEKYQWLLSIVGLKGSVEQGKTELSKLIDTESAFSLESLLLLSLSEAYILQEPESAKHRLDHINTDESQLLILAKMSVFIKNSQSGLAIKLFESTIHTNNLPHLNYLAAEAYLQKGDYDNASRLYNKYINEYSGQSNIKDSFYKRYLCKYLSQDTTGLTASLQQAKSINIEITEADRYATKILEKAETLNKGIMQLRLATDGGFYATARKLLNGDLELVNQRDSVEIIYREARLEHKTNNLPQAMALYKAVISKSKNDNWYFAPNSALMLGHLYADQKEYKLAKDYYLKAKSYRHHEYKNSIDTKAEAGLNLIKGL
ncbi:MAG TPA: hypothetical protein PKL31_11510 [Fulvivirga sp.]|nr:hypothetical protein [Fulvivirga sp.]